MTFRADHIFRDALKGHATAGGEITVCLGGGTVRTKKGEVISYLTDPRKYFIAAGRTYLFVGEYYHEAGDFYESEGAPRWDLTDGFVRANFSEVRAKAIGRPSTLIGLSKDELIRSLDQRFSQKRAEGH